VFAPFAMASQTLGLLGRERPADQP
jgi:hypothetical protein